MAWGLQKKILVQVLGTGFAVLAGLVVLLGLVARESALKSAQEIAVQAARAQGARIRGELDRTSVALAALAGALGTLDVQDPKAPGAGGGDVADPPGEPPGALRLGGPTNRGPSPPEGRTGTNPCSRGPTGP